MLFLAAMMTSLYKHQETGIQFLIERDTAMLADEMGLGKTRQALTAAMNLYKQKKIDQVLVMCPAAVRYSWREELEKLGEKFNLIEYKSEDEEFYFVKKAIERHNPGLNISICSYGLMSSGVNGEKGRYYPHVKRFSQWLASGESLLICDESSFLKSRNAQQSKGTAEIAQAAMYRWLLTGTPIANSPLDLWSQGFVMAAGLAGPLKGFENFFHFRNTFFVMGGFKMKKPILIKEKLQSLQNRFAPYVLRRLKKDCLDLPEKVYEVREVALQTDTWKIYQELKEEALLTLPPDDSKPEPNAAVRILRLCQLTSGHVGILNQVEHVESPNPQSQDISNEKLKWIADEIIDGELQSEEAIIVWCRWKRERERLAKMLVPNVTVWEIYGGQSQKVRDEAVNQFQNGSYHRVLLAQPQAGGYGLNLTQAAVAVYLSNDWSHINRVQSEDRCHRIGQKRTVTYLDVLATGPKGQKTVDHHILEVLKEKKNIADLTCSAWRRILED